MATDDIQNLKLDDEGDLVVDEDEFANKSFRLIVGQEAIRQDIQVRVLTTRGERILHPEYGLDFPKIETAFDENLVRGEVVRAILEDPDVQEILDIEIEFEGRTRHASFKGNVRLLDDEDLPVEGTT